MKKEKTISVLTRIADSPVRPKNLLFSLTGCFALLFLGGLGFFSSVKDMSAVPGAVSFWIFPLAGVALLLTFLFGLFLLHKKKRLALLLSGGLLCSLLLFQRKALLAQGSSFLGYLHARLERFYGISLFSDFSGSAADNSLFFFFCTLLFLILVCLTLWYRKKVLFLFLLLLAPVAQFVTEIRPSFLSAGCFLVCFFLWDCLSAKETSSGFLLLWLSNPLLRYFRRSMRPLQSLAPFFMQIPLTERRVHRKPVLPHPETAIKIRFPHRQTRKFWTIQPLFTAIRLCLRSTRAGFLTHLFTCAALPDSPTQTGSGKLWTKSSGSLFAAVTDCQTNCRSSFLPFLMKPEKHRLLLPLHK